MGEYGPGMSMGRLGELDKERVNHALNGELVCGEGEHGFVYEPAPKEECDAYVLSVIDHWVYQAKHLADSGRAMERVMQDNGFNMMNHFREYVDEMAEAVREHDDYLYEHVKADLLDEAEGITGKGGAR